MRRLLPAAALLAAAPALAAAQGATAPQTAASPAAAAHGNADPDKRVAGGLRVPGWSAQFDRPGSAASAVSFVRAGAGYHVTAGPAALYFDSTKAVSGAYAVRASFTQTKAPTHPEAYGLFVGGRGLGTPAASYLYLIIRGDGRYAIKQRSGANEVKSLFEFVVSPALHAADAGGRATNALRIHVAPDSVHFYANDQLMTALATSATGPLNGVAGFRVNHNLDVQVDGFAVTPGAAKGATAKAADRGR